MKRGFDIETEDLPTNRRVKNYKLVHSPQPQTNLLKQAQFISRTSELKNIDYWVNSLALSNTQTWSASFIINEGIGLGTNFDQRIGRKVTMTKLQFRYQFEPNVSGNGTTRYRILIVYDKQANSSQPVITDVLTLNFGNPGALAFNNLANSHRFITVADVLTEDSLSFYTNPIGIISRNINLDIIYNGDATTGNYDNINTGSMWVFFCQSLVGLVSPTTVSYNSRIRYLD